MSSQRSPGSHLYPSNGLHAPSGLSQACVTGSLPALPDGVLEVLGLLPQLLEFVHGGVAGYVSLAMVVCWSPSTIIPPPLLSVSICYLTKLAAPPVILRPLVLTPHL